MATTASQPVPVLRTRTPRWTPPSKVDAQKFRDLQIENAHLRERVLAKEQPTSAATKIVTFIAMGTLAAAALATAYFIGNPGPLREALKTITVPELVKTYTPESITQFFTNFLK
jgi:hypothetical protein